MNRLCLPTLWLRNKHPVTTHMIRPVALSLFAVLAASGAAAAGMPESPSLKPDRPYASTATDSKNAEILHKALAAAERYDWKEVASLQQQATDPAVRDLIMWTRASEGVPGMGFSEVNDALTRLSDWPKTGNMRARAEEIIELSSLSATQRIDWLKASGPRTGEGKVALANALREVGKMDDAMEVIRDAWHSNSMDRTLERQVLARFGGKLTQDDHRARVEFLLWTNQRTAAANLKQLLTPDYRKLVDARIALAGRSRNVDALVNAVPENLQDNPGLLYDRARWRRAHGNQDGAIPLLTAINGKDIPEAGRTKLWKERSIALRSDLKDGQWKRAYQLASPHGMEEGADFADAEWVSGWIALRMNSDPERALQHFETMTEGVSTPISLARGEYWTGRAEAALGETARAQVAYLDAAAHKSTYYGQLAAEEIGDKQIYFAPASQPTDADIAAFEGRPMVKALRLLGEAGETQLFRTFAYHLDDLLESEADYIQLSQLATEYHVPDIGVRGAKAGLAKGIIATDAAYPLVSYPLLKEPQVERSLMLALSRQESEMNPSAVSYVGARGLMQFMPATASREAKLSGLPYRQSWLTDDPGYNMTLGGQHLDYLLNRFNGSYIMTAAAYNAGPTRPSQWIADYGDPRTGDVDPIDWVEFIPFSETRNYVQRIIENTQVYRSRISGKPEEIQIQEDLKRGEE